MTDGCLICVLETGVLWSQSTDSNLVVKVTPTRQSDPKSGLKTRSCVQKRTDEHLSEEFHVYLDWKSEISAVLHVKCEVIVVNSSRQFPTSSLHRYRFYDVKGRHRADCSGCDTLLTERRAQPGVTRQKYSFPTHKTMKPDRLTKLTDDLFPWIPAVFSWLFF